jgi:hypothetical protein
VALYNGNPVVWKTARQSTVSTSTTEAECNALFSATCEVIHLRALFEGFGVEVKTPVLIHEDNSPAVMLVNNAGSLHGRAKHFQVRLHFVREVVQQGSVKLKWVSTKDQLADGFTKGLGQQKFKIFSDNVIYDK